MTWREPHRHGTCVAGWMGGERVLATSFLAMTPQRLASSTGSSHGRSASGPVLGMEHPRAGHPFDKRKDRHDRHR